MSQLAIALHKQGHHVTGSDDEIKNPSKSDLNEAGILPSKEGWYPEQITDYIDTVILGMHALADNPELTKAKKLGINILSFPEFIYNLSKQKQRIVIGGSHGKTTIVSMIIHVLREFGKEFDYVCGSKVAGFDQMVQLTDAPLIIIEGDEYPSSKEDTKAKFLNYHHHIGIISGIAWDHVNAYPTFDEYVQVFEAFADQTPKAGTLILNEEDDLVTMIGKKERSDVTVIDYKVHPYVVKDDNFHLIYEKKHIPVQVIGRHNMQNIEAARLVCKHLGVPAEVFYDSITRFKGATKRMEPILQQDSIRTFSDFAHSPSKVGATVNALKETYPNERLTAVLELHTFSSLRTEFLPEYRNKLEGADMAAIFISKEKVSLSASGPGFRDEIISAFGYHDLKVFEDKDQLEEWLLNLVPQSGNYLFMSSGNFDGLDIRKFSSKLINQSHVS